MNGIHVEMELVKSQWKMFVIIYTLATFLFTFIIYLVCAIFLDIYIIAMIFSLKGE